MEWRHVTLFAFLLSVAAGDSSPPPFTPGGWLSGRGTESPQKWLFQTPASCPGLFLPSCAGSCHIFLDRGVGGGALVFLKAGNFSRGSKAKFLLLEQEGRGFAIGELVTMIKSLLLYDFIQKGKNKIHHKQTNKQKHAHEYVKRQAIFLRWIPNSYYQRWVGVSQKLSH